MAKSIVKSVRISDILDKQIEGIALEYGITDSHLINAILTTFCLEYAEQKIKNFSPHENKTDIK